MISNDDTKMIGTIKAQGTTWLSERRLYEILFEKYRQNNRSH